MIDQLIKLVQQNSEQDIVNNSAIPNQFNGAAIETVARQIFSGLQAPAAQGKVQDVTSLFNGVNASNLTGNPIISQIVSQVAGEFASRFGVSPQMAQNVAAGLIPKVMNQFINKTNDPDDKDFDLQDMLKGFSGGGGLDVGDLINKGGGLGGVLGKMMG